MFSHGNKKVDFTGNNVQNVRTNNSSFYNIEFNNTNAENADIVIQDNILVTNFANFERGIVNTGANSFIFGESANTTIGNEFSFIDGKVEKLNSNELFTFPTGNVKNRNLGQGSQDYRIWAPIGVLPENPTNLSVKYHFSNENLHTWWHHTWSHEDPLTHTTDREYWTVNSGEDATITLHWKNNNPCYVHDFCDEEDNFLHESLTITYWDNKWYDAAPTNIPQGDGTNGYITTSFPIAFGAKDDTQITFGGKDSEIPLPITLLSFKAECAGNSAVITWVTASEYNNEYFILEKSNDAKNFVEIARIDGAGFSNQEIAYFFNDDELSNGDNYYRLTQVDYDGTFEVFKIVNINCDQFDENEPTVIIYPNPFRSEVTVLLENIEENEVIFEIYDEIGKLIYIETYNRGENADKHSIELNNLKPSVYYLRTRTNKHLFNNKIIKQ